MNKYTVTTLLYNKSEQVDFGLESVVLTPTSSHLKSQSYIFILNPLIKITDGNCQCWAYIQAWPIPQHCRPCHNVYIQATCMAKQEVAANVSIFS